MNKNCWPPFFLGLHGVLANFLLNHNNFDTSFVKIDQVLIILCRPKGENTHFHYCSKSYWPYWLTRHYVGWFKPLITSCWFSYAVQFFWFPNVWKWTDGYHFTYKPQSPNLDWYYHESAFLHPAYKWDNIADLPLIPPYWKSKNFSSSDTFKKKLTFSNCTFFGC